jgi:hypothetical protein
MTVWQTEIIVLFVLKLIGLVEAIFAVIYFAYVGIKNRACRKDTNFLVRDSLMYFFLYIFAWCKLAILVLESR